MKASPVRDRLCFINLLILPFFAPSSTPPRVNFACGHISCCRSLTDSPPWVQSGIWIMHSSTQHTIMAHVCSWTQYTWSIFPLVSSYRKPTPPPAWCVWVQDVWCVYVLMSTTSLSRLIILISHQHPKLLPLEDLKEHLLSKKQEEEQPSKYVSLGDVQILPVYRRSV